MTEDSINESILNIRSFHGYLEHILESIDVGKYHEPTVEKLSQVISEYYQSINNVEMEDVSYDSSDNEESTTYSKSIVLRDKAGSDSEEETDSDTSDEEEEDLSINSVSDKENSSNSSRNSETRQKL